MLQYVNPKHPAGVLFPQPTHLSAGSGGLAPLHGDKSHGRPMFAGSEEERDPLFHQHVQSEDRAFVQTVLKFLRGEA